MFNRKLSSLLKVLTITLVVGVSSVGITLLAGTNKLDHLFGSQKLKGENAKTSSGRAMSADAQSITPATDQMNEVPKPFQGTIVYQGKLKANEKVIALTFDDGPGPKIRNRF